MKQLLKTILFNIGLLEWIKRKRKHYPTISLNKVVGSVAPGIDHHIVSNQSEFMAYLKQNAEELIKRSKVDQQAKQVSDKPYFVKGSNFLLPSGNGFFIASGSPNLREDFCCSETGLNNRVRATLFAISRSVGFKKLKEQQVYLTEAVTGLSKWFFTQTKQLTTSEFLGVDRVSGSFVKGVRHEDLTRLSFKDQSFDLTVCLEVLEHIPDFLKAFSELARITRTGGSVWITVPFLESSSETIIRASFADNGGLIHHLPPEYHGDPVNEQGGILCFQHFGWDMLDQLKACGFSTVKVHLIWSASELMLDRHIMVFEAIK